MMMMMMFRICVTGGETCEDEGNLEDVWRKTVKMNEHELWNALCIIIIIITVTEHEVQDELCIGRVE